MEKQSWVKTCNPFRKSSHQILWEVPVCLPRWATQFTKTSVTGLSGSCPHWGIRADWLSCRTRLSQNESWERPRGFVLFGVSDFVLQTGLQRDLDPPYPCLNLSQEFFLQATLPIAFCRRCLVCLFSDGSRVWGTSAAGDGLERCSFWDHGEVIEERIWKKKREENELWLLLWFWLMLEVSQWKGTPCRHPAERFGSTLR